MLLATGVVPWDWQATTGPSVDVLLKLFPSKLFV
jgi:hypothetical protein